VQHLLPAGAVDPVWPIDGVGVCTATGDQKGVSIVADGSGGAILVWGDGRSFATNNYDIYVQRLSNGGVSLWTINGVALCDAQGLQENLTIVADNAGGAFVAWNDQRPGANSRDIFAHHVTNLGVRDSSWPTQGAVLSSAIGDQELPKIVLDGASGAIVGWQDLRSGSDYEVFAQRVSGSGSTQWATNGVPAASGTGFRQVVQVVSDGAGGALLAWADFIGGDIYAQRLAANGAVASGWPMNGTAVCTATGPQTSPTLISDAGNGGIIAWDDGRVSGDANIFAQRVTSGGEAGPTTGVPNQVSRSLEMSIKPNPAIEPVTIRLVVDVESLVDLRIHDLQGREVACLAHGVLLSAGVHELLWPLSSSVGHRVQPGLYFARASIGMTRITRSMVVME